MSEFAPQKPVFRLAIVMPVHNRREVTLRCLEALRHCDCETGDFGLDVAVTVVDDGSTDGTSEAIRSRFPGVEVLLGDGNLFFAAGTNLGLRHAMNSDPDYVLTMNDDSFVPQHALIELVRCARANPRTSVGAVLVEDGTDRVFQVDPRWETWFGGWHHHTNIRVSDLPDSLFAVQTLVGNCLIHSATDIRGLDLPTNAGYGDVEFIEKLRRQRGIAFLICPNVIVDCEANTLSPSLRSLSPGRVAKLLISSTRHPLSLRFLWSSRRWGAPNFRSAVGAFIVQIFRMVLRAAHIGAWPNVKVKSPPFGAWTPDSKTLGFRQKLPN